MPPDDNREASSGWPGFFQELEPNLLLGSARVVEEKSDDDEVERELESCSLCKTEKTSRTLGADKKDDFELFCWFVF